MKDSKYIVFKFEEFDEWMREVVRTHGVHPNVLPQALEDAVVIRTQDHFAAPALDSYANSIRICTSIMLDRERAKELDNIADYFHERAVESWRQYRKMPD